MSDCPHGNPLYSYCVECSGPAPEAPAPYAEITRLRADLAEVEARGYRRGLEDAAKCCEDEADKCDDAFRWGGAKKYLESCKSAAYAMRNRANAIRAIAASADPTPPAPAGS